MKRFQEKAGGISACLFCLVPICAAQILQVRVEEPTGIYRRSSEVVRVPIDGSSFTVSDPTGRELPWQKTSDGLLFPASVIPGELPVYKISRGSRDAHVFASEIVARKIGLSRIELGNSRFRVVIDTTIPAIVEAYNLSAEEHRKLNLVETTPENPDSLKNDIHTASDIPPDVPGVEGENIGWTSLAPDRNAGAVEFLETGPLRGRVHLSLGEFEWTAGSPVLIWKSKRGFRFLSISATPYVPFDHCVSGDEYDWPQGPDDLQPRDSGIGPRSWSELPGGHMVYYNGQENYGALGIVSLDGGLHWKGAGSRRFIGENAGGPSAMALLFTEWDGPRTTLNARRDNAILRHPLLVKLVPPAHPGARAREPAVPSSPPASLSLDGEWRLAYADKGSDKPSAARAVKVPGDVHVQWYPGDPFAAPPPKYYTHAADWISYKEWWYTRSFRVPLSFAGKRLRLQFDSTDYYADTYLNGQYIGRHEGYIDPYEYDVSERVRSGALNEIQVRIWTPVTYYWRHRPYYVKGSYGAVDQKPDDITAEGITRSVRLVASGPANIQDVSVNTRLLDDNGNQAEVEVNLETAGNPEGCMWDLALSSDGRHITAPASAARVVIPVDHPRLWWTWDHGAPNLYQLDIRLLDGRRAPLDTKSLKIGIREIEKIGWTFYLNRKRLFIRGTNYYYNLFLSEMNRAAYDRDLDLMRNMNVNMIRLHTHFENPEFYDLADQKGILIWQDYLEAWYPHDRDFALRAAALYDPLIKYVRNHPSIAIWATSDEEDLENYRVLTKHLAARPALLDPQHRPVVRSTGRYGDAHVYHGWYEGSVWQYTKMTEPFVSELGATALPNYDSIMKFLPDAWPIQSHQEEWIFHKLQIPEAMRAWGQPDGLTLQQYIPQTQAYVARLFQIALERSRRLKYAPAGGILHFHAIDIWPSVTMAAVDFYRQPTKAFDTVRRSFAPVLASLEYDRDRWKPNEEFQCGVWAINDEWREIPNAQIRWRILDSQGASALAGSFPVSFAADSSRKLGEVRWTANQPGSYQLRAQVFDAAGNQLSENIFEFRIQ